MIALQISHTVQTSSEHCSTTSHCLALSYWRCSWRFIIGTFPKWPISTVMDAWFNCAKMALSLPSKLLSQPSWWAVLILSPLTFCLSLSPFSNFSDGNHCESYPPKNPFHQEQMYSIIYWFSYLCTLWLLPPFPVYLSVFVSACMCAEMPMSLLAYACVHVPVQQSQLLSWAENHDCIFSLMLSHIVIPRSICNILLFRNPTINHLNYCWQTSKRFWLAAHFLSISNTQVGRNTKEQKL